MSVTASAIAIIIALILFFILCYRGVGISHVLSCVPRS